MFTRSCDLSRAFGNEKTADAERDGCAEFGELADPFSEPNSKGQFPKKLPSGSSGRSSDEDPSSESEVHEFELTSSHSSIVLLCNKLLFPPFD